MKKSVFTVVLTIIFASFYVYATACTSAIITGKVTANGKPLLWKHRDTGQEQNRIEYFTTGKYTFLGVADAPSKGGVAWAGTNSTGFAIMNTASYNLKDDDVKEMDKEGKVMYRALEICANLADFEVFLDTLTRPMGVEANFGVIDALGGAAYYEVNNHSWVKIDVNDPSVAPGGYLVYTNFSYTGRINEGMGYMRYQTATALFQKQAALSGFTPRWIFEEVSRSFYHAFLGMDLKDPVYSPEKANGWFLDQDFIPRRSSACSIVIEGVEKGEDPLNTIMWVVMGYPPAGVSIPLWVQMGKKQPDLLLGQGEHNRSPLCEWAVELKHRAFPVTRGNGSKYMYFKEIYNEKGTGFMQQLAPVENQLYDKYGMLISFLEKEGLTGKKLDKKRVSQMYEEISDMIQRAYGKL
ncbi:MAG: hypothetical protein RBQ85_05780 [Bacteroidales bacterium]|jgi:hypothetical protein|nr:hypothetical protein [Bacteroidales bacterium]